MDSFTGNSEPSRRKAVNFHPTVQDRSLAGFHIVAQATRVSFAMLWRDDQLGQSFAGGFYGEPSKHDFSPSIPIYHQPLCIDADDRAQRRINDGAKAGPAIPYRLLGTLTFNRIANRPGQGSRICPPLMR